jgi:hypothetical protein
MKTYKINIYQMIMRRTIRLRTNSQILTMTSGKHFKLGIVLLMLIHLHHFIIQAKEIKGKLARQVKKVQ